MWSHYSGNHKGFSIEYIFDSADISNTTDWLEYPTTYSSQIYNISTTEILLTPDTAFRSLLTTKSIDWTYEKEIRLIHTDKSKLVDLPKDMKISAIYAGNKIECCCYKELQRKAEDLGIPLFQMKYVGYQLIPQKDDKFACNGMRNN